MIHYHGTPITPAVKLQQLAGRNFCVSYAAPAQVQECHKIGQSVMLDNGAFTFWRQDKQPDWPGYYEWCERWLDYRTTWAVIPDVIDGTEEDNDALLRQWFLTRLPRGAPVWHMHEPLERLRRLCHGYERVCIGSSGSYSKLGTFEWHHRMQQAMNLICGDGPPPTWLHMLRGLGFAGSEYPFASADSTNVAQNHAGNNQGRPRQDPARMAAEIDAKQCPARWTMYEQMEIA